VSTCVSHVPSLHLVPPEQKVRSVSQQSSPAFPTSKQRLALQSAVSLMQTSSAEHPFPVSTFSTSLLHTLNLQMVPLSQPA
jgi:hypothetical protein